MLTCVLNAAEGQLDIVLGTEAEIICAQSWPTSPKGKIKGAEVLTPALHNLFSLVKYDVCDVRRWACVHGPGSFTGIRLVLGTVAAIRRISNAQNASIDFMQALALEAMLAMQNTSQKLPELIWVLTHARANMVHCQAFIANESCMPQAVEAAELRLVDDIINALGQVKGRTVVVGSGIERNKEALSDILSSQDITTFHIKSPSHEALWHLALHGNYHEKDIEPLYVRPCDAVENLDAIARKQGLEPSEARAKLAELLNQHILY